MAYDFEKALEGIAPAQEGAPLPAPAAPKAKYDFEQALGGIVPTQADTASSMFTASFENPDEQAKLRKLSDSMSQYLGETPPTATIDVKEAERRVRLAEADHATRASPRTQAWLSREENAKIALDDAKTLAETERVLDAQKFGSISNVPADYSLKAKGELLGKYAKAGGYSLASAVAKIVHTVLPTMSDEELAILYHDDPKGLEKARNSIGQTLNRLSLLAAQKAEETTKSLSPATAAGYADLEYATLDPSKSALLSIKPVADALQSLPTTLATMFALKGAGSAGLKAEAEALAAGATKEAARAAAVKEAARVGAISGGLSEGITTYAQNAAQQQDTRGTQEVDRVHPPDRGGV